MSQRRMSEKILYTTQFPIFVYIIMTNKYLLWKKIGFLVFMLINANFFMTKLIIINLWFVFIIRKFYLYFRHLFYPHTPTQPWDHLIMYCHITSTQKLILQGFCLWVNINGDCNFRKFHHFHKSNITIWGLQWRGRQEIP